MLVKGANGDYMTNFDIVDAMPYAILYKLTELSAIYVECVADAM